MRGRRGRSGTSAKPRPLIYGHIRSGNHALASLVQEVFYPRLPARTVYRGHSGHWTRARDELSRVTVDGVDVDDDHAALPYGLLLGGHGLPRHMNPDRPAIYVYRDGRDVALSAWVWKKMRPPDATTFARFVRMDKDWRWSAGKAAPSVEGHTFWHGWRNHVDQWLACPGVLCVRYERMVRRRSAVVREIADFLSRAPCAEASGAMAGWNAGAAPRVGKWRSDMDAADVGHFDSIVPRDHVGRWPRGK